jgi:DNA-binding XRE family transcriptional regulator
VVSTTGGVIRAAVYQGDRELRRAASRAGDELRAHRLRAGLSQAAVARAIGISRSVICELEQGDPSISLTIWSRVTALLGGDLRIGVYAMGQPLLYDAAHARIVERLLRACHERWRVTVEATIPGPGGRSSDIRLEHDGDVVLVEVESRINRLEEIVRECHAKRQAVATAELAKRVHVALAIPRTNHHRLLVEANWSTFAAAFPVDGEALERALADPSIAWPGDGLIWAPRGPSERTPTSSPGRRPRRAPGP